VSSNQHQASRSAAQPPDVGELVVSASSGSGQVERARVLGRLAGALAKSAKLAGVGAVAGGRWLAEVLTDAAPRIPVRDAALLRTHHPGRTDDEIAELLVRGTARATAAIGAAAGVTATAEYALPPALLAAPIQLAAETLAVAAAEVKLVAELHELYGEPARGTLAERGSAYLMSWVRQRAVEPVTGGGLTAALGHTAKRKLRARLLRRAGRNATSLAPMLAGAIAGAEVNRRATRALGEKLVAELRGRRSAR
jgi:uncharacterized protein YidB (DUF937 family)